MKKVVVRLLIAVAVCLLFICAIAWVAGGIEQAAHGEPVAFSNDGEVYGIDANTILQKISSGETDIFELLPNEVDYATPIPNLPPVRFTSTDYLQIKDAFNRFLSDEEIENWEYSEISYGLDCEDISYGPQEAFLSIVKYIVHNADEVRVKRSIVIEPYRERISWFEEGREVLFSYPTFDYANIKISAEEALEIAEINGGKEFRPAQDEQCTIAISISASHFDNGWEVRYIGTGMSYEVHVNKDTGEYEIIEQ